MDKMRIVRFVFVFLVLGIQDFHLDVLRAQQEAEVTFSEGREGVEEMLVYILSASKREIIDLTDRLQPTREEYELVFDAPYDKEVWRYHKRLRRFADVVVHPILKKQTAFLLWSATTEQLRDYEGEARNFPGGYREMAAYMKPGLTFYRFKFVEPGRKLGSAYDALIYLDGNWRIFHRPWTVMVD